MKPPRWLWRLGFAARMRGVTHCSYKTAFERADAFMSFYEWDTMSPSACADRQIKLWGMDK